MPQDSEPKSVEEKRAEAERKRKIQALEMQRERVLSERTSSPHRRSALELALADIERMLQELGWSLKM
jgi:ferredoxin-fold anticodon binding domain-containing protein